eukprot:maker-scaffold779_size98098-snap-gene-0.20 protein:Tk05333 transcript:maker-scaffold779_size98098-snap-gene-0.20-mRNA-1 annotation:"proclotting enzyme"
MRSVIPWVVGLSCVHVVLSQISFLKMEEDDDACVTPLNQPGQCIGLLDCPSLSRLLVRPVSERAKAHLRQSVCRYESRIPDVCCPLRNRDRNISPSTTPMPTTTSTTTTITTTTPVETTTSEEISTPEFDTTPFDTIEETTTIEIDTTTEEASEPVTLGPTLIPSYDECGQSIIIPPGRRIVGGTESKLHAWPWLAALGYEDSKSNETNFLCGGSLITKRHILTAAHCVIRDSLKTVRLGEHEIGNDEDGAEPVDFKVVQRLIHDGYNSRSFHNDIAILTLDRDVTFTPFITPICLPLLSSVVEQEQFQGFTPFIAGWGSTRFRGPTSKQLLEIQLQVLSNRDCNDKFQEFDNVEITPVKMCAYDQNGIKDACQGDSGGPMMTPQGPFVDLDIPEDRWFQLGIVSFGYKCAVPGFPGVYTRVTEYSQWIRDNLNEPYSNAVAFV